MLEIGTKNNDTQITIGIIFYINYFPNTIIDLYNTNAMYSMGVAVPRAIMYTI